MPNRCAGGLSPQFPVFRVDGVDIPGILAVDEALHDGTPHTTLSFTGTYDRYRFWMKYFIQIIDTHFSNPNKLPQRITQTVRSRAKWITLLVTLPIKKPRT